MSHFVNAIRYQYGDFSGRATRTQYWMYNLCNLALYFAAVIVNGLIPAMADLPFLVAIYLLATFIPSTSITCRRLHDTGRSGWWQLVGLVPAVGWIVLIVFLVQGSSDKSVFVQDINPGQPTGFGLRDE